MSFAEQRKAAYYDYMVNPEYFGEAVTYRSVVDATTKTINVQIRTSVRPELNDQDATLDEVEEINVLMMRDPLAQDSKGNLIGGVAWPEIGDAIKRSSVYDAEDRWYYFKGTITETTELKLRLVFERKKRRTQGVAR